MKKFKAKAAAEGVDIAGAFCSYNFDLILQLNHTSEFEVSDAFIITIIHDTTDDETEAVYLVEPFRTTSVIKYSGTTTVGTGVDQKSVTAAAFAHFVLHDSACQYLFVDIQGTSSTE